MATRIDELTTLLRGLPPRSTQILSLRLLKGASREGCAAHYGITPEAFDVMLLRAAQELVFAERGEAPGAPPPFFEEEPRAQALKRALEDPTAAGSAPEARLLRELVLSAAPLQAALTEAERLEEASPWRKRENVLRWLAVAAIALLTAWFYLRGQPPS
ncbi:MAG: hypothetical protein ACYC8T_03910 [Myxococcaceae bacterium]